MPVTIHHEEQHIPARTIPAYDEMLYSFDELSGSAKTSAFDAYLDTQGNWNIDFAISDIRDGAKYVLDQIGAEFGRLHDWAYATQCHGAHFTSSSCHPTSFHAIDNGDWASAEFADAYNERAPRLRTLAAVAGRYERIYDDLYTSGNYTKAHEYNRLALSFDEALYDEFNSILYDLARLFDRLCTSKYDYYLSTEAASEYYANEGATFSECGARVD